ncbi:uridine-cytidine kinase C-like [Ananas comosus]|uniref:Uridine-cytidine kinase C-like n=1 Tax=Ananas comosus TaxID=4615 RepID=A0A6P5GT63_ANACO|nr:uridine-cytidine kinase C-like [Ananas comosus]
MEQDEVLQRVLEEGGRDYYSYYSPSSSTANPPPPSPTAESTSVPSTATSSSSSILQSLPLHVVGVKAPSSSSLISSPLLSPDYSRLLFWIGAQSFDHGYYLLVKAIQELREKKAGQIVTVGIGGPSGSGKTSLSEKVASVLGCVVISMEDYRTGVDDANDVIDSIDFDALVRNLQDLVKGKDTLMPLLDFQEKKCTGWKQLKISSSGVVIVDGAYALHSTLRSLLDIRVAVVGGVHFSLLSKVRQDIGDSCSLDYLIDSIFPLFRKHIEPDLHHAQSPEGKIIYSFDRTEAETENFIEMYLRPPFASEEARINDWIKVRQCGIRYYLSLGDQRIVDKNFIIRPKAEFEVGRTTLGGLLALGYNVVVSYKRACTSVNKDQLLIAVESIDTLNKSFLVLKGTSRKVFI